LKFVRNGSLALAIAGAAMIAPSAAMAAGSPIDTSGSTPTASSAATLNLPGVLVLNKSDTTTAGAQETVLEVAGLNLLSKNGAGVNQGALAIAGTLVDTLNHALCPKGTEAAGACIALLFTNTTTTATTNNASGSAVALTLGKAHIRLLGSEASTTATPAGCVSTGIAFLANFENVVAIPSTLLQNGTIAGPGTC
jgi:hypothetical protein